MHASSSETQSPAPSQLRLAELMAAISLAIDLGVGQPMEWVLRCTLLGVRLSATLGLGAQDCRAVYYLSLLRHIGCTANAAADAALFGDELAVAEAFALDMDDMQQTLGFLLRNVGRGQSLLMRARLIAGVLAAGPSGQRAHHVAHCEVAVRLAQQLGFDASIQHGLWQIYERWDGNGTPHRLAGEAIALPVRVVQLAQDAATLHQIGGMDAALAFVRRRSARVYDPAVVDRFCRAASELLDSPLDGSTWDAVLAAEPGPPTYLDDQQIDAAAMAIALFADLKSPHTLGHSQGVAELATRAAAHAGLSSSDVITVQRAGWLHDLGRVGVSTAIWSKPGPLTDSEWERVRLHPYYTERVLMRVPALMSVGALAAAHHERLDGSGYHRRIGASQLAMPARILAAADIYQAMIEPRPYRSAIAPEHAAAELLNEAQAGRIDRMAVQAVLAAAGHVRSSRRPAWPAGLTDREVAVLRLLARGASNRVIAAHLTIAEKTVSHHIQHIYDKIDVSTRAAAALFAMQHDLLDP